MPNWKKVITSGSDASLNTLTVVNGITGSLFGTASYALTASNISPVISNDADTRLVTANGNGTLNGEVNLTFNGSTLNVLGNTIITGSLAVGTGSLGASENTITLGARDSANEGGQIGFNAPGGTWTSASFIDNWSNQIRILRGSNTTSDGLVTQWNLHTKQMQLPAYTAASSFPGTATANLAVDSGGNVITVSTTGGTVFPYTGNAVITGSLTATTSVIAQANGAMYFRGGDDAELWDINVVNTVGVYGQQDQGVASIKLGSGGGTISGRSGSIGIGTINPTSASLTVNGNVWATSFTGSLLGTASYASQALSSSFATTASYALTAGNGGVTKIIAGANVNLSPVSGLGDVTVTAFGTNLYNTATGSYGSFYDTGSVTATSATTIYSMSLSTTDISNGVFVSASGADITRVKFTNAGTYNVQFSSQFSNIDNSNQDVVVWLRKNGTDIPDSSGTVGVPPFKAGSNGQVIASWNYYVPISANDFIQLCWRAEQANVITLETIAAGTSPTYPRTPSTILTATRVDTFLSNTGSFSGSFTGILTGTASYASQALSSSFATTASYVLNAISASFSTTASYATRALSASYAPNTTFPYTGSAIITGSLKIIGDTTITGSITVSGSTTHQIIGNTYFTTPATAGGNVNIVSLNNTPTLTFSQAGTATRFQIYVNGGSQEITSFKSFVSTGEFNWLNNQTNYLGRLTTNGNLLLPGSGSTTQPTDAGYRLDVSGSTRIRGYANTSISSSLLVYGSGSSQPVFTVQGSQGELFSVTDSLSGSLFSVNDISGLPVLEAFSDNTVLLGSYQAPALLTTNKIVLTASGNFTLSSLPTASYDGAFYEYTAKSGSNARAGSIMAVWGNGGTISYTETATSDIGSTSGLNLGVFISGANIILTGSASTTAWTIKTIIRSI
jgi:hypothetical protein